LSVGARSAGLRLGSVHKNAERHHACPAAWDKFTLSGCGVFVEMAEMSIGFLHHGGTPLPGQAEDHQRPFGFLLSSDGFADFRLVRESSALRGWRAKDIAVALDWSGRAARSSDRVGDGGRRHGRVAPRETGEALRWLPSSSFNQTTSTTVTGSFG